MTAVQGEIGQSDQKEGIACTHFNEFKEKWLDLLFHVDADGIQNWFLCILTLGEIWGVGEHLG